MIKQITDIIATAARTDVVNLPPNTEIVDVRDMVDKEGNTSTLVELKIRESIALLENKKKIIICCDYGLSRSNSIAVGVVSRYYKIPFEEAVKKVIAIADESAIKLDMLSSVFNVIKSEHQSSLNHKNVLVTGASGFVGKELLKSIGKNDNVFSLTGMQIDLMKNILALDLFVKTNEIKKIVHLANPRVYTNNSCISESLLMLKNVLDVCRENKVGLVYISSWEVFSGYKSNDLLADENLAPFPKGTYGESKWLSELLIQQYHKLYNLKYVILRSSPVYGASNDKPKFIFNFIQKAKKSEDIFTHKYLNGFPKLDLIHISDFVDLLKVMIKNDCEGVFNIGAGITTSTYDIAKYITSILGSTSKVAYHTINSYYPGVIMNTGKLENVLGWSAKVKIEDGIKELVNIK